MASARCGLEAPAMGSLVVATFTALPVALASMVAYGLGTSPAA